MQENNLNREVPFTVLATYIQTETLEKAFPQLLNKYNRTVKPITDMVDLQMVIDLHKFYSFNIDKIVSLSRPLTNGVFDLLTQLDQLKVPTREDHRLIRQHSHNYIMTKQLRKMLTNSRTVVINERNRILEHKDTKWNDILELMIKDKDVRRLKHHFLDMDKRIDEAIKDHYLVTDQKFTRLSRSNGLANVLVTIYKNDFTHLYLDIALHEFMIRRLNNTDEQLKLSELLIGFYEFTDGYFVDEDIKISDFFNIIKNPIGRGLVHPYHITIL